MKGQVGLLPVTIGGAITNITNKAHTDVYTDTFPDGITIDMEISDFVNLWQTALYYEEYEIEFTPEEVSDLQH